MSRRNLFYVACSAVIVGLAAWYVYGHWQEFRQVELVSPGHLFGLAAIILARMTLRGIFRWQVLQSLNCSVTLRETLQLEYSGAVLNQLLPLPFSPGYRAAYLRQVHKLPLTKFASTLAAFFVFFLFVSTLAGLIGFVWIGMQGTTVDMIAGLVLVVTMVACVSTLAIRQPLQCGGVWAVRINRIVAGWKRITRSPSVVLSACGVAAGATVLGALGIALAFAAFGILIDVPAMLLLISSQRLGGLLTITPGAVGYQEMVGAYFATMLSMSTAQAILVLSVIRIVRISVALCVGLPSLWMLARRFKESPDESRSDRLDASAVQQNRTGER